MLLLGKTAIIYGAGGAIGASVARAMAHQGARVFLAGRTLSRLRAVAATLDGGRAGDDLAQLDALDQPAVERHADSVAAKAGRIDIALNAVGVAHVQGVPLLELSLADYSLPVGVYTQTNFITAKAVARHMRQQGSGVILTLSTPVSGMAGPGFMGHCVACAGVEAMSRHLAGELGADGVRVICLRSHAIPEALQHGSHSREVFGQVAGRAGVSVATLLTGAADTTLLKRLPTLRQLADAAVFAASTAAGAMTGTVLNLSCGMAPD